MRSAAPLFVRPCLGCRVFSLCASGGCLGSTSPGARIHNLPVAVRGRETRTATHFRDSLAEPRASPRRHQEPEPWIFARPSGGDSLACDCVERARAPCGVTHHDTSRSPVVNGQLRLELLPKSRPPHPDRQRLVVPPFTLTSGKGDYWSQSGWCAPGCRRRPERGGSPQCCPGAGPRVHLLRADVSFREPSGPASPCCPSSR